MMRGPRMVQGMHRRVRLNPCFMHGGANGALDAIHAHGVRGGVVCTWLSILSN
jgi:hypothetical protein